MTDASLPDFEMIGLFGSSNHRSCERHAECGKYVNKNDTLRLVSCLVEVPGGGGGSELISELSIKLVKIEDGIETCTVAFVPKAYASMPSIRNGINKFVTVLELYADSPSAYKQRLSEKNQGMGSCRFLERIPANMT
jgi:hypothetical protein